MKKIDIGVIITTLIIVTVSTSFAYYMAKIVGTPKDVNVIAKNINIKLSNNGLIGDTVISPGWSKTNTFTITNNSDEEYKYNIIIKDLVNTFETYDYLQYKITSDNNGYNMSDYKDVPKSSTSSNKVLAHFVSVPARTTQNYTIEFIYKNTEEDQSIDMGKILSGTLSITEGEYSKFTYNEGTLGKKLLTDKTQVSSDRPNAFAKIYQEDNTKTLYTSTEDNTLVYYFAGNATDNWVKFGGYFWRIIRTNSDGSIRLLYHGTTHDSTTAYIGTSKYNSEYNDLKYVGYMYESNTVNSTLKETVDTWYKDNFTSYTKYLSNSAVYCNDRTSITTDKTRFGPNNRVISGKTPSYDCPNNDDKFTVDSHFGNGSLTYPVGLMTADELSYAGSVYGLVASTWFTNNSLGTSSVNTKTWWTLSLSTFANSSITAIYLSPSTGLLGGHYTNEYAVRPVTSLKSCVEWSSGDGSASSPYEIQY